MDSHVQALGGVGPITQMTSSLGLPHISPTNRPLESSSLTSLAPEPSCLEGLFYYLSSIWEWILELFCQETEELIVESPLAQMPLGIISENQLSNAIHPVQEINSFHSGPVFIGIVTILYGDGWIGWDNKFQFSERIRLANGADLKTKPDDDYYVVKLASSEANLSKLTVESTALESLKKDARLFYLPSSLFTSAKVNDNQLQFYLDDQLFHLNIDVKAASSSIRCRQEFLFNEDMEEAEIFFLAEPGTTGGVICKLSLDAKKIEIGMQGMQPVNFNQLSKVGVDPGHFIGFSPTPRNGSIYKLGNKYQFRLPVPGCRSKEDVDIIFDNNKLYVHAHPSRGSSASLKREYGAVELMSNVGFHNCSFETFDFLNFGINQSIDVKSLNLSLTTAVLTQDGMLYIEFFPSEP
jgi:hypothetical protein